MKNLLFVIGFVVIGFFLFKFVFANLLGIAFTLLIGAGIIWIAVKGAKWLLKDALSLKKKKPKSAQDSLKELTALLEKEKRQTKR